MVNFGIGPAFVLGIFLVVAGAGLYFLRSVRPELSRDHDIFFAAVGLVCGLILMFYGWQLEPALQFGQFLLAGTTIFFAYEAIRMRGIATEQARRNTPIVDDDRPVSRVYREAKLDDLDPYEGRRLTGTRDPRDRRRSEYETASRRPKSRGRSDRYDAEENVRSTPRRSRPSPPPSDRYSERYGEPSERYGEGYDSPDYPSSRPRRPRPETRTDEPPPRPRRPRSRPSSRDNVAAASATDVDATPVDYQPIESEDELDNRYGSPYGQGNGEDYRDRENGSYRGRDEVSYGRPYDDDEDEDEMGYGRPYEDEDESDYSDRDEDPYEFKDDYELKDDREDRGRFDY